MSAPLKFARSEILRRELIRVDPDSANVDGSPTIRFTLPTGSPGAWDLSTLTVMCEVTIRNSAGNRFPQTSTIEGRVFAQEMISSHLFSTISGKLNGVDVSDEDGGLRSFPDAYRKMLTRPAEHFASRVTGGVVPLAAGMRYGSPTALNQLGYTGYDAESAPGYRAGEFLDSVDTAFHADASGPDGVLGLGGPADTRVNARKLMRARFLTGLQTNIAFKPHCALTSLEGLIPADVSVEVALEKNSNLAHLIQARPGFADLPPKVTWKRCYLLLTRIVPKATHAPALYRPIVAPCTRHVYTNMVLPRQVAGTASFSLPQLITGPRPDVILFAVTADAPIVGSTFASVDDAGGAGDDPPGRSISLLGSGQGASITSNDAGADRTAPYVTIAEFRATWGGEQLPAYGPIRQSDRTQEACAEYFELHKQVAEKLGGGGLSLGEFEAHFHVALDMSKEIDVDEKKEAGALSVNLTLTQSCMGTAVAGAANTFRLHTVALYHGGTSAIMLGDHSASASGRRAVTNGW